MEHVLQRLARIDEIAAVLSLVGGGCRLEILSLLTQYARDVQTLADDLDLEVANVSRNLKLLRDGKLVRFQTQNRRHVYSVTDRVGLVPHGAVERGPRLELFITDGLRVTVELPPDEAAIRRPTAPDRQRHAAV